MVEDITTALSRIRWLFVIARNSAFTYKGRAVDVRQVGRELGVRYVLEGSVRKAGGRVRITGQLDRGGDGRAMSGRTASTATLDDIFDLQDRVTEAVGGAIEPNLQRAEIERARRKPTGSLDAYDLYLRALPRFQDTTTEVGGEQALVLLRGHCIDPGFALGKAYMAWMFTRAATRAGWRQRSAKKRFASPAKRSGRP